MNDTSRVIRRTIVSDPPSCDITFGHDSEDSSGVNYTPREHL